MWYWGSGMGGGWFMLIGGVVSLAVIVGIILLIVWAVRKGSERRSVGGTTMSKSPLDIARERYARGEITKEQYEQLKKDLS